MKIQSNNLPLASNFDRSFLDFERGIRVGHLDPSQRITQIVKALLIARHNVDMICDRWGRGVYWQWVCWVPRPNREAKPLSSGHNFASAKFFVSIDRDDREIAAGMQIERAASKGGADSFGVSLQRDWDWHVMLKALKGKPLPAEIKRLLHEGFRVRVGPFSSLTEYNSSNWNPASCHRCAARFPSDEWGMFQLAYAIPEKEVRRTSGAELIEAVLGVFDEVTKAMNYCMYSPCLTPSSET